MIAKLFVDDERTAPEGWNLTRTAQSAINWLVYRRHTGLRVRRHRDTAGHLCPMSGRSIPGAAFICPSNDVHVRIACA